MEPQRPHNRGGFDSARVAGIDEAGRGCLAGPVAAAAVILPANFDLRGLADSKRLSPQKRDALAAQIKACALAWSLGLVWQKEIDKINILQATLKAMSLAAASLSTAPGLLLIDGNQQISRESLVRHWFKKQSAPLPERETVVDGDALIPVISAASILAKTGRDALMARLAKKWPQYGFEKHKGYGTKEHYAALRQYGPCPLHRLTFKGVRPSPGQLPLVP